MGSIGERRSQSSRRAALLTGVVVVVGFGCSAQFSPTGESEQALSAPARGLAIDIEDGVGVPLSVRAGQTFYVNQIDLRASINAGVDEGVAGLKTTGAASALPWSGVRLVDEEPVAVPNPDGTFIRRRFYREAAWMDLPSWFVVEQLDAQGRPTAIPVIVGSGLEHHRLPFDDFFVRRLRAIQWTYDCPAPNDCTGAQVFSEEALVELRDTLQPGKTFTFTPATTQLRVIWSLDPTHPYAVPVTQVAAPPYDYGLQIDVAALTPPAADGTYSAGQAITFQLTLRDDSGNRLHAPGVLPSYNEATFGPNPAGIYYYRGFIDPTTTYYRRKHRERNFIAEMTGPRQKVQPIRSVVDLGQFFAPTLTVGVPSRDGVFGEGVIFPQGLLFQGAFDPNHTTWNFPASDTFTFHLPPDAEAGTYDVTIKSRRAYLGEDVPRTKTIQVQVGTTAHTEATMTTGGCNACHSGGSSLAVINHANSDRATCTTCHAPLAIELEGPVYVRTHFIHSRTDRLDAPLDHCANCHLGVASIQRTSKSACLSCHKSYPNDHVVKYGPITSMYIGGDATSFQQCTSTCHRDHPGSGL
ncbi:MAG TPA: cytochrome C [Polyangia bacterium]|nr:cytochrome C [Polyangia bacterium]